MAPDSLYGSEDGTGDGVDTAELAKYMEDMKGTIQSLSQTYETLQKQRAVVMSNAPVVDSAKQIQMVRKQLVDMDKLSLPHHVYVPNTLASLNQAS